MDSGWIGRTVLGFSGWFEGGERHAGRAGRLAARAGRRRHPVDSAAAELTTFGLNGLTALHLLRAAGDASTVLVTGAAGGVGKLAVELAIGAGKTVIASASEKDREELIATGAQFVSRDAADVGAAVRGLVPGGVDAALNTVPGSPVGLDAVRDGGI